MSLRLVVIDDEILVRKGIISSVEWEKYGIEVAGEATDGRSALELIRQTKPHIVLTDIRMPHMDGLEMIRTIRGEFPATVIFILSVLDDFQTVREALRLGVADYIPKLSMTPEELLQVVLNVKRKLAAGPASASDSASVSAALVAPAEEMRQADKRNEEPAAAIPIGHPSEICEAWLDEGMHYRIAKIKAEHRNVTAERPVASRESYETLIGHINARMTPAEGQAGFVRVWYAEDSGLWILAEEQGNTGRLAEMLSRCKAELASELRITAGISGPAQGRGRLKQAAGQAESALGRSFYRGLDAIYTWNTESRQQPAQTTNPVFMPKETAQLYFTALDADPEGTADRLFRQLLPVQIPEYIPQTAVREEVYHWVSNVNVYVKERGGSLHSAFSGLSPFEELGRLKTYPEIREWCLRLHDVLKSMLSVLKSTHRREITKAIDYVQAHYMQPIRIKDIAEWVHLSENYFSNVFAKETGKPFIQFLQEIRVEQAKRMLKEEDQDWILVGEKAGFENPKYFTKVFKKFTGVTPKQYSKTRS